MRANKHEGQALAVAASVAKLDPHADPQLYIEGLFGAAARWICAGLEWRGAPHNDKHQQHGNTLKSAGAPAEIPAAWKNLEDRRAGDWYGGQTNGGRASQATTAYNVIMDWALAGKPPASSPAAPPPNP